MEQLCANHDTKKEREARLRAGMRNGDNVQGRQEKRINVEV